MSSPLLSAAMIVRDEAAHLEDCLRSIRPIVDEIILVDTGSVDNSKSIARRFDAKIFDVPWRDDFAAARNEALDRASGQWILYIDADERLRPTSNSSLHALLRRPSLVGCFVHLHAHADYMSYREMRLFRNHSEIRFEGVIHENIWPSIHEFIKCHGGDLGESKLILDHVGYHGDQHHKHQRNLPLLLARLAEDPDHFYSCWHLGSVYLALGDKAAARRAWLSGIEAVRRCQYQAWEQSLPFIALIQLDFGDAIVIEPLLAEALHRFPDNAHLIWMRGQSMLRQKNWLAALADFERLSKWQQEPIEGKFQIGYDKSLFDLHAFEGLATCHFRLGNYDKAQRYYGLANQCSPSVEFRTKQQLCMKLLNT